MLMICPKKILSLFLGQPCKDLTLQSKIEIEHEKWYDEEKLLQNL